MRRIHAVVLAAAALPSLVIAPADAQDYACAVPSSIPAPETPPELNELRRYATGRGVRVAVVDTGVAPNPELDQLRPARDFVADDPLLDCDSHGTVVAGVIGGTTLGIAPGAELISIRQTSAHYRDTSSGDDAAGGNLQTLTDAIHTAVDEGARVINVSVVSCVAPSVAKRIDDSGLIAALDRAERSGAVVVAAAGNLSQDCEPGFTVFPAAYPTVLAVGARSGTHAVAQYSMEAPLSATGVVPAALSSSGGGWAGGTLAADGVRPYTGTSFAAPVVSGSVALVLERSPHLSPKQVRELVAAAAEPGGGAVDPLAVVTQLQPDTVAVRETLVVDPAVEAVSESPLRLRDLVIALFGVVALALTVLPAASRWRSARPRG